MRLEEIINLYYNLHTLLDKEMKAVLAFKLTRIIKKLEEEVKLYEEQKNKILEKYCIEGEEFIKDGKVNAKPGEEQNLMNELNELINTNIDIELNKISIAELESLDTMTLDLMIKIEKIIEE